MSLATYLTSLEQAAEAAASAEHAFKVEAEARGRALAAARAEAFRRMNFLKGLAESLGTSASGEEAVQTAHAYLRNRLGWHETTPARSEVLEHFTPVALAVHGAIQGATAPGAATADATGADAAEPNAPGAMAAFEDWYVATRETPFWYLFEHYMPQTPLVDF